ncbi:membrane protein, putative [Babesia bigemina]|uniref:Membrane protein, putative n=1 Tax=Babesia bigemina TaxID=5866 RepID=A0A061D8H7_BABBI|nr:membrane protein, putative [Babesia bigemina]CDR94050.1 membrane protein, putative [Babesia bigemina]|eukprot:XP_012766236.1 membrane protein, putative [Babesia bigemina]
MSHTFYCSGAPTMKNYVFLYGIYLSSLLTAAERRVGQPVPHSPSSPPVGRSASVASHPHFKPKVRGSFIYREELDACPNLLNLLESSTEEGPKWKFVLHVVTCTLCMVGSCCLIFLSLLQTGRLFSQGMWSLKFYQSGGFCILGAAFAGLLLGMCLGFSLGTYYMAYLISGFMLLGAAVIYVGRRGAVLGAVGGTIVGLTLGVSHSGSVSAVVVEGVLCLFAGIAIGFIPIFPNLKINVRYIQHGVRANAMLGVSQ